jgi:histidinol-phosphate phosphatase family protein
MTDLVDTYLQQLELMIHQLSRQAVWDVVGVLFKAWREGRHVFILGNGGSASTAAHMANDLNKYPNYPGLRRFKAIALSDNVPVMTALANDFGYDCIFAEQLENFLEPGDVVIGISTSGNSANVLNAMRFANEHRAVCVGFTGPDGGKLVDLVEYCIHLPSPLIGQQEDGHLVLDHVIVHTLRQMIINEANSLSRTAIFVDRDGVISENRDDYVKTWEEFVFLPGVFEPLHNLAHKGIPVIVVSNQSAVGRGLVSQKMVDEINLRMAAEIKACGGAIEAIFTCPHRPEDDCDCRKPRPGLLLKAAQQCNVSLKNSFLIGDAVSDIDAAQAVGCQPILVQTGRGSEQALLLAERGIRGVPIVKDLSAAVDWIIAQNGHPG